MTIIIIDVLTYSNSNSDYHTKQVLTYIMMKLN